MPDFGRSDVFDESKVGKDWNCNYERAGRACRRRNGRDARCPSAPEDVGGFDVAVNVAACVKFGDGVADLQHEAGDGALTGRQVARFEQLHREIGMSVRLTVGVEARKGSGLQG